VEKAVARFGNETVEKELPGYRKLSWSVEISNVDFLRFATTLAKFENAEPLIEFTGFEIQADREQADTQRVLLSVHNIIKQ
jgi:erythromycin esterase-like protein